MAEDFSIQFSINSIYMPALVDDLDYTVYILYILCVRAREHARVYVQSEVKNIIQETLDFYLQDTYRGHYLISDNHVRYRRA